MSEAAVWYWNQKGKAQGPFSFDQVKTLVAKGDLRGHELVFKEGATEWKRASEWSELAQLFEDDGGQFTKFIKLPEEERTVIRTDNKPPEEKWVVLIRIEEDKEIRFKQKGPYPTDEIKRYLREGKISHSDHIWKKGAPKWIAISEVPDFHVNQLNVTEEVKDLLDDVTQMPTIPHVVVKPEPAVAKPEPVVVKPEPKPVIKIEPKAEPKIEFSKPEPKPEPKPEIPSKSAAAMIPVIPHAVPSGGSSPVGQSPRVESFGSFEAQVVSPTEEETGLRNLAALRAQEAQEDHRAQSLGDEKTEITNPDPQIETQVYVKPPPETTSAAEVYHDKNPVSVIRVPLRVEPRAEPRHPDKAAAPAPVMDESARARGWLSKLSPALSFLLLAFMGLGIWATLKTRSPILTADRPLAVQDKPQTPALPPETAPAVAPAKPEARPAVALGDSNIEEEEIFDREIAETEPEEKPVAKNDKIDKNDRKKSAAVKNTVKEVKEPKEKESREVADLPNITSEPKSTNIKVNNKAGYFEVVGSFRKGELLEVRIDGNSGAILDLPALHQKLEVRSTRNFVHRLSLTDLRIPKGNYQFSVKWGSSRSSKKLAWGGEKSQLEPALVLHRKQIVFDQQQEKKKIVRALRDFSNLLTKAESEAGKGNLKAVGRDLTEKMPAEVKIVRLSRHELIYSDQWEKLANQWDRLQTMVKEGGRGPASVSEISKAKKAMSILESDIRNQSAFDGK